MNLSGCSLAKATHPPETDQQRALQSQINALCRTHRLDIPELLISKAFPELPAVSYRDSNRRCVILHQSLFDLLTDRELLATALHELGHISKLLTENSDVRTEVSCDLFAVKIMQEKESMVSAIQKIQDTVELTDLTSYRLEVLGELDLKQLLSDRNANAR